MQAAAANAPIFLSALYDGIEALRASSRYDLPAIEDINDRCRATRVGFELDPPNIVTHSAVVLRALTNLSNAATDAFKQWGEMEAQAIAEETERPFPDSFDVAITVAGPDRKIARDLAQRLQTAGLVVFYDQFFDDHIWGHDLPEMFDDIFRVKSRFCVIFISRAYATSEWANLEKRSALARAMKERGKAYVLPIRIDDTILLGLPPTVAHLSLREKSIEEI